MLKRKGAITSPTVLAIVVQFRLSVTALSRGRRRFWGRPAGGSPGSTRGRRAVKMGRCFRPFAVYGGVMAADPTPNPELGPSTIEHGGLVFTVHYLRNTSHPQGPPWFAFT